MTVPIKITYSGDEFVGKTLRKEAHAQISLLKGQMSYMQLKQGRREISPYPGVIITVTSCFGADKVNIHVSLQAGKFLREKKVISEILEWYWYALCISTYPPDPITGIQTPINGGEGLSDIAIDNMQNVWIAGYSKTKYDFTNAGDELSNEGILIKYDKEGRFKGRRVLVGGSGSGVNKNESATGVVIDRTSNALVPMYGGIYLSADTYQDRFGVNYDTSLVKYASDGVIKWQRRLTFAAEANTMLLNWGVAAGPTGNAFVWGLINFYENVDPYDYLYYEGYIASFAYDGSLNWKVQLGDDARDEFGEPTTTNYVHIKTSAPDHLGSVYACGTLMDATVGAIMPVGLITKLDNEGVLIWKRAIQGLFRQANGLYGWYGTGDDIEGCAVDATGNLYTISKTRINLGTNTGYFHFNVKQILANGTLGWQRTIETQYYSDATAAQSKVKIAVDTSGVYIVAPRHPGSLEKWGVHIIKFRLTDSGIPAGPVAGDVVWQRLMVPSLMQFPSSTGIMAYSLKASGVDLFIAGTVLPEKSAFTLKLPTSGGFIGYHKGLTFTNTALPVGPNPGDPPILPVYSDPEDIPVRQDPGPGEGDPGYEFNLVSIFNLPILAGPMSVISPITGDYVSPIWNQTNKIIKSIKYK